MDTPFQCWRCGETFADWGAPIRRSDACPKCKSDFHSCRMCLHYSKSAPNACRDQEADRVDNKEAANFCESFTLNPAAAVAMARTNHLDALFGETGSAANETDSPSLDDLFSRE